MLHHHTTRALNRPAELETTPLSPLWFVPLQLQLAHIHLSGG